MELTERQKKLLKTLQNQYEIDKTAWLTSKEIYALFTFDEKDNYNDIQEKDAYKGINEDYHAINSQTDIKNIIIANRNKGYKIGTKEEVNEYFDRKKKSLKKAFARLYNVARKAAMDGYLDLFTEEVRKVFEVA